MHRPEAAADWLTVQPEDYNVWQRLAVKSRKLLTPGNLFTTAGLVLVVWGLYDAILSHWLVAIVLLIAGRLCDLIDGWVADKTRTKNVVGAAYDSTVDKLETALILITFVVAAIFPWWVGVALIMPHMIISVLGIEAIRNKWFFFPARTGKYGMAAAWVALPSFLAVHLLHGSWHVVFAVIAYLSSAVAFGLSSYAAVIYVRYFHFSDEPKVPATNPK